MVLASGSASSASVAGGSPENTQRHSSVDDWLSKMPSPRECGDPVQDSQISAQAALFKTVARGCLMEPAYILEVHRAYADHIQKINNMYHNGAPREMQFAQISTFGKLDEEEVAHMLCQMTDITDGGVKKVMGNAAEVGVLFEAVFQLSGNLKLLPPLQIKEVCRAFVYSHHDKVGGPWKDCCAKGAFDPLTGTVKPEKLPAYVPVFGSTGKLEKIRYRNGDEAAVALPIAKGTPIRYCWSDWRACYPMDPMPDYKLHLVFKKLKSGPYREVEKDFGVKDPKYVESVNKVFKDWEQEKEKGLVKSDLKQAVQEGKKKRVEEDKAKKKNILDAARAKGLEAVKAKKRKFDSDVTG